MERSLNEEVELAKQARLEAIELVEYMVSKLHDTLIKERGEYRSDHKRKSYRLLDRPIISTPKNTSPFPRTTIPRKIVYPIRDDGKRRDFSNDKEDEQKDQELHSIPLYDPQAVNHGWENGYDNDPINGETIDYNFLYDNFQLYGFPFDPIQTAHQNLYGNEDPINPRNLNENRNPPRSRNGPGDPFLARDSIVKDNDELNEISQFLLHSFDDENQEKAGEKVNTLEKKKIQSILLRNSMNVANSENVANQPQPDLEKLEAIENPLEAGQTQEETLQQPGKNGNESNDGDGVGRDPTTLWMSTATPIPR